MATATQSTVSRILEWRPGSGFDICQVSSFVIPGESTPATVGELLARIRAVSPDRYRPCPQRVWKYVSSFFVAVPPPLSQEELLAGLKKWIPTQYTQYSKSAGMKDCILTDEMILRIQYAEAVLTIWKAWGGSYSGLVREHPCFSLVQRLLPQFFVLEEIFRLKMCQGVFHQAVRDVCPELWKMFNGCRGWERDSWYGKISFYSKETEESFVRQLVEKILSEFCVLGSNKDRIVAFWKSCCQKSPIIGEEMRSGDVLIAMSMLPWNLLDPVLDWVQEWQGNIRCGVYREYTDAVAARFFCHLLDPDVLPHRKKVLREVLRILHPPVLF